MKSGAVCAIVCVVYQTTSGLDKISYSVQRKQICVSKYVYRDYVVSSSITRLHCIVVLYCNSLQSLYCIVSSLLCYCNML